MEATQTQHLMYIRMEQYWSTWSVLRDSYISGPLTLPGTAAQGALDSTTPGYGFDVFRLSNISNSVKGSVTGISASSREHGQRQQSCNSISSRPEDVHANGAHGDLTVVVCKLRGFKSHFPGDYPGRAEGLPLS
jgi:hypothetical protein